MSWSVSAIGKPSAVAEQIAKQCSQYKCAEPEETIRAKFVEMVTTACAAFPDGYAVRVEGNGSQSMNGDKALNSLSVKIEPIYGLVL